MGVVDDRIDRSVFITSLDFVFNWARRSSLWWLQFGLACCGMEMVAASMSRFDMCERFGRWFRPTPRQADLMFVAGTVTKKMAPFVRTLNDQMPEPKWVIAMGSCACVGGPFDTYAVVQGVDQVVPVDVYVPGCPPTPEALYYGVLMLQNQVIEHETMAKRQGLATAAGHREMHRLAAYEALHRSRDRAMSSTPARLVSSSQACRRIGAFVVSKCSSQMSAVARRPINACGTS